MAIKRVFHHPQQYVHEASLLSSKVDSHVLVPQSAAKAENAGHGNAAAQAFWLNAAKSIDWVQPPKLAYGVPQNGDKVRAFPRSFSVLSSRAVMTHCRLTPSLINVQQAHLVPLCPTQHDLQLLGSSRLGRLWRPPLPASLFTTARRESRAQQEHDVQRGPGGGQSARWRTEAQTRRQEGRQSHPLREFVAALEPVEDPSLIRDTLFFVTAPQPVTDDS